MSGTAVQALVDATLDTARTTLPGAEFSITLSRANSLLLPLHDRQLDRVVEGRIGYYGGHVYRDAVVWNFDMSDSLVVVTPVNRHDPSGEEAMAYYGDLRIGAVATSLPNSIAPTIHLLDLLKKSDLLA